MSEKRTECGQCGATHTIRRCDECGSVIKDLVLRSGECKSWEVFVARHLRGEGHAPCEKYDACGIGCAAVLVNAAIGRGLDLVAACSDRVGLHGVSWTVHDDPRRPGADQKKEE